MSDKPPKTSRPLPLLDVEPVDWMDRIVSTFVRVNARREQHESRALTRHHLTVTQFDVLASLISGDGITQQEMAARLLVTKGNVVGLVDRLCAAGFVERRSDPEDRRANRLHLTKAGRERFRAAAPDVRAIYDLMLGGLSGDEMKILAGLLRRLEDALGE